MNKKVVGISKPNYWERLKRLRMISCERRAKRYNILYIWKIIGGLVPYVGISLAHFTPRLGRMVKSSPYKGVRMSVKTLKEISVTVEGPELFNSLPSVLRDHVESKDSFKSLLDKYENEVPDHPGGFMRLLLEAMDFKGAK